MKLKSNYAKLDPYLSICEDANIVTLECMFKHLQTNVLVHFPLSHKIRIILLKIQNKTKI